MCARASRAFALICALVAFGLVVGCTIKVETKVEPAKEPEPPEPQQPIQPAPVVVPEIPNRPNVPVPAPVVEPKDRATPLEFQRFPFGADWVGIKPGDTLRVIGRCVGSKGRGITFENAGRYYGTRPTIPAAELASAFKTDPTGAKYKDRIFVVEGVCAEVSERSVLLSGSKTPLTAAASTDPRLAEAKAEPVAASVAAQDLFAEKDPNRYQGKVIEVTGCVSDFYYGNGAGAQLLLGAPLVGGKRAFGTVECELLEFDPWDHLTYRQTVTVRGRCGGAGSYTKLSHCVITKEAESPVVEITAENLAKEYKKDKQGTISKYFVQEPGLAEGRSLLITGEVLAWIAHAKPPTLTLKGADGVKVNCYLAPGMSGFPTWEAPVGTKVELIARFGLFSKEADTVWMNMGHVRKVK
jgi:hypothetical protein